MIYELANQKISRYRTASLTENTVSGGQTYENQKRLTCHVIYGLANQKISRYKTASLTDNTVSGGQTYENHAAETHLIRDLCGPKNISKILCLLISKDSRMANQSWNCRTIYGG